MSVSELQHSFFDLDEYLPPPAPPRWYVHLPYAVQIHSKSLVEMGGRLHHRHYNSAASDGMRRFVALECEVGERVAARFILDGDYPAW